MRRRGKPAKAKVTAKLPVARKSLKNDGSKVRDLEKRLAEALRLLQTNKRELDEALVQQTATGEILKVISSAPTDVQSVINAVAENAARLCGADDAVIRRVEGDTLRLVAWFGAIPLPDPIRPISRDYPAGLSVIERRTIHIDDISSRRETEFPRTSGGLGTVLTTPLLRQGVPIGVIVIRRTQVQPFTEKQIALLQTFADQAVIALENARLFNETKEALEQQTATAEILRVISSSPTNVQPVLDAVAESAAALCDARDALIIRVGPEGQRAVANYGPIPAPDPRESVPLTRATPTGRAIMDGRTVHVDDLAAAIDDYPQAKVFVERFGTRTVIAVPLLFERRAIGCIAVRRSEVRPFTDKQMALLQTFADQAVIAIENVRLFNETKEALEQQATTSEILGVISRSPTDVQPVFDTIAESAARLCEAYDSTIFRREDDWLLPVAHHGAIPQTAALPLVRGTVAGRTVLDGRTVHIADVQTETEEFPESSEIARRMGFRTILVVPLMREGVAIGTITLRRNEVRPFAERQVELLKTFADQAVIAIENVRLFKELQEKNRVLTESLDQQTATSEILQVISQSPTEVQPVFDAIVRNAVTLCGALWGIVWRFDGDAVDVVGHHNLPSDELEELRRQFPGHPGARDVLLGIRTGAVSNLRDIESASEVSPATRARWRRRGVSSALTVPMRRENEMVGAIGVSHREPGAFSQSHVELLKTFADQAVIAIENVRLFKELDSRNRDLTATSEILQVIASSPTDAQPVFDTIARNARRLCAADSAGVVRLDGEVLRSEALDNASDEFAEAMRHAFPNPVSQGTASGRAILEKRPVLIPDVVEDPEYELAGLKSAGLRSVLSVPMLRHGAAIGCIVVHTWATPRPFTDAQIELLKTFADQAVIAIENVRLFTELQARTHELTRSVGQLTALGEVGRAVSSTLDLQTVLTTIVARATQLAGADAGVIYEYDERRGLFEPRATERLEENIVRTLVATPIRKGEGATGQLAEVREPIQVADVRDPAQAFQAREVLVRAGYRAALAVPLVREDRLLGGLTVFRKTPGEFASEVVDLLRTFATQSALAIQNARLFLEIEDKSRQLEIASQHKSEFLANMSHELRTPLNAIIGFSEVLSERMFGELNEKQEEYSKDIHASGQHLLSLINDILDLSKIEAGRMELELTDFDLPTAIDNALMLVRERAQRRSLTLHKRVDGGVGQLRADERKIRQVVLNLLSNAIKFTPEGGWIEVGAVPKDGSVEVAVSDTGVGIAPEDQDAIFEEFRQVGTVDKKAEGTGLGLTLCRKFIELHGGKIWVKSELGAGSTFTFTIPERHGE